MIKNFSKLMVAGAAIVALAGSVVIAEAGSALKNTDGPAVTPLSPGGSVYGPAQLGGSYQSTGAIIVGVGASGNAVVLGTGVYQTNFRRNIVNCVWTGSIGIGTFSGSTAASSISVTGRAGTVNALFVQTFNSSGAPAALPFAVHIICG